MNPEELTVQQPIKILVVDDREDNLLSIETILDNEAYQIVKANSGKAALKALLNQQDFTLILMDVQMPDMNGFETASLIYQRDRLKHIPIIFITAHDQGDENVFEGYKLGAVDFIYKPINPELLRFKVGVFAEMYQKTHQLQLHERRLKQMNADLAKEVEERRASEEKVWLLNRQLMENNANLKATIEELDRFAYVASHDLQEPLRKILVFSDKLRNANPGGLSDEMQWYLERIRNSGERMRKLINDILVLSRPADGLDHLSEVNLSELLAEVLSDMEVEIDRTGTQIKIDALPRIRAIPTQMRQLFQNLVSNAIKFKHPERVPEVAIYQEAEGTTGTGDAYHRIVVMDNGIGFDDQHAEEIFAVFRRLHSYQQYEGNGVGLAICKKIVDRHNGRISARSHTNGGAMFILEFPVQDGQGNVSGLVVNELSLK